MAGEGIGMHPVWLKMAISPCPWRKSVSASPPPWGMRRKSEIYLGGLARNPFQPRIHLRAPPWTSNRGPLSRPVD
jgi:hypothetical protein